MAQDPVPYIVAEPLPSNILEWRYVVTGPEDSLYRAGLYHGKLVFPSEFPFKPPAIYMSTPNGRFKTDMRLCLSISGECCCTGGKDCLLYCRFDCSQHAAFLPFVFSHLFYRVQIINFYK